MSKAKCFKCGGSAIADTFEEARRLINHAIGLSRGIKCGDAYGAVQEIGVIQQKVKTIATQTKKEEPKIIETIPQEVEPKTEKTKTTSKKPKAQKS